MMRQFYHGTAVTVTIPEHPPESVTVRKTLKRRFDQTANYPIDIYWTWNPRYYNSVVRTKVSCEAYPDRQEELDAIARRLGLSLSVILEP